MRLVARNGFSVCQFSSPQFCIVFFTLVSRLDRLIPPPAYTLDDPSATAQPCSGRSQGFADAVPVRTLLEGLERIPPGVCFLFAQQHELLPFWCTCTHSKSGCRRSLLCVVTCSRHPHSSAMRAHSPRRTSCPHINTQIFVLILALLAAVFAVSIRRRYNHVLVVHR